MQVVDGRLPNPAGGSCELSDRNAAGAVVLVMRRDHGAGSLAFNRLLR